MASGMKTVEVLALEKRVQELERENALLRSERGAFALSPYSFAEEENVRPIDISERQVVLQQTAVWSVKREWHTGQLHAVGRCMTSEPTGDALHISYYTEDLTAMHKNVALDVLGRLHDRTCRELARMWVVKKEAA